MRLSVKDNGFGIPTDKLVSRLRNVRPARSVDRDGTQGIGDRSRAVECARDDARWQHQGVQRRTRQGQRIRRSPAGCGARACDADPDVRAAGVASSDEALCRVLVVDDNQDVALPMARWMRQLGHEVRVALDGPAAIQLADEDFRPEVVLLDIGMPNMNGYEVARALRSISWGRELVLVAVTGWGQEDDQRRSAEAGFDRHMTKRCRSINTRKLSRLRRSPTCRYVARTSMADEWRDGGGGFIASGHAWPADLVVLERRRHRLAPRFGSIDPLAGHARPHRYSCRRHRS